MIQPQDSWFLNLCKVKKKRVFQIEGGLSICEVRGDGGGLNLEPRPAEEEALSTPLAPSKVAIEARQVSRPLMPRPFDC